jgi:hypothetical protein
LRWLPKDNTASGCNKESDFAAGISRTESTHPNDFADVEDYYVQAVPGIYFPTGSIAKIDLSFRKRNWLSFATGDWGNFTGDSEIKTVIFSPQILIKNSMDKVRNNLILGFDYQNADNGIVNESLFFGLLSKRKPGLKKEDYGYYFHDEINIADSLYVSGGYRHDRTEFTLYQADPRESNRRRCLYGRCQLCFFQEIICLLQFLKEFSISPVRRTFQLLHEYCKC